MYPGYRFMSYFVNIYFINNYRYCRNNRKLEILKLLFDGKYHSQKTCFYYNLGLLKNELPIIYKILNQMVNYKSNFIIKTKKE